MIAPILFAVICSAAFLVSDRFESGQKAVGLIGVSVVAIGGRGLDAMWVLVFLASVFLGGVLLENKEEG